jgi:CHASE2 domain-containing sensor protein
MTEWTPEAMDKRIQDRMEESKSLTQTKTPAIRPTTVVVTDIHMSFSSMVIFMVKWAIASIPALLILFLLGAVAIGFLKGLLGSSAH